MTQAFWLAALKTDGPITGNITGSWHIRYHGYRRIARLISNKEVWMAALGRAGVGSTRQMWMGDK